VNQLKHVDAALSVLGKLDGGSSYTKPRRTLSSATRKKMSLAEKARWAKSILERPSGRSETQPDNVSSSSQEDCCVSARTVGEGEGTTEEGCITSRCHYGKAQTSSAQMAWDSPGSLSLHPLQLRVQGSDDCDEKRGPRARKSSRPVCRARVQQNHGR